MNFEKFEKIKNVWGVEIAEIFFDQLNKNPEKENDIETLTKMAECIKNIDKEKFEIIVSRQQIFEKYKIMKTKINEIAKIIKENKENKIEQPLEILREYEILREKEKEFELELDSYFKDMLYL